MKLQVEPPLNLVTSTVQKLKLGDLVDVHCSSASHYRCRVLYIPCATGDSWILENEDKQIIYVQTFEWLAQSENIKEVR